MSDSDVAAIFEPDDMRMLVDIGFMALWRGDHAAAAAVFAGVVAARPHQEAGHIGTALVQLFRGEADAAVATLRRLPPSDAARLYLGLALSRRGDLAEARDTLAEVAASAAGTPFGTGARDMLDGLKDGPKR